MNEVWKDVVGYEGLYQIDLSNVNTEEKIKMWLEYRKYGIHLIFEKEEENE